MVNLTKTDIINIENRYIPFKPLHTVNKYLLDLNNNIPVSIDKLSDDFSEALIVWDKGLIDTEDISEYLLSIKISLLQKYLQFHIQQSSEKVRRLILDRPTLHKGSIDYYSKINEILIALTELLNDEPVDSTVDKLNSKKAYNGEDLFEDDLFPGINTTEELYAKLYELLDQIQIDNISKGARKSRKSDTVKYIKKAD